MQLAVVLVMTVCKRKFEISAGIKDGKRVFLATIVSLCFDFPSALCTISVIFVKSAIIGFLFGSFLPCSVFGEQHKFPS